MLRLVTSADTLMRDLKARAVTFVKETDGATAIEYGLIAAGIAVAIIAAVFALGSDLQNFFTGISGQMQAKAPR